MGGTGDVRQNISEIQQRLCSFLKRRHHGGGVVSCVEFGGDPSRPSRHRVALRGTG
jgi:hypothetical protein